MTDEHVRSLYAVGGAYEYVAISVELGERCRCTGEPTGEVMPWRS